MSLAGRTVRVRKGRVLTLDITAKLSQHEGWRDERD